MILHAFLHYVVKKFYLICNIHTIKKQIKSTKDYSALVLKPIHIDLIYLIKVSRIDLDLLKIEPKSAFTIPLFIAHCTVYCSTSRILHKHKRYNVTNLLNDELVSN